MLKRFFQSMGKNEQRSREMASESVAPINQVKPFIQTPLQASFKLSFGIDGLSRILSEEENVKAMDWAEIPYLIEWQLWSGGYHRYKVCFHSKHSSIPRARV